MSECKSRSNRAEIDLAQALVTKRAQENENSSAKEWDKTEKTQLQSPVFTVSVSMVTCLLLCAKLHLCRTLIPPYRAETRIGFFTWLDGNEGIWQKSERCLGGQSDFQNITEGYNLSILNLGANTLYHRSYYSWNFRWLVALVLACSLSNTN